MNDEERVRKVADLLASLTSGDLEHVHSLILELSSEDGGSGVVGKLTDAAVMLAAQTVASNEVLMALSEGRLGEDFPPGVPSLGPYKQLQANLRHLLWHLDRVAAGDYSQRTEFLGDFTSTFDALASSLQQKTELEIELKQSEQRYRTLVETATIPIFILNADTTIQYMNDLGGQFLGLTEPMNGSIQFLDFLDDSAWMDFAQVSLDSSDGSVKDGEILLRDRNDRRIWAFMSARRIDLNGSPATFVSCNDITERKRAEEQLALANRKLTLLGSVTRHDVLNHLTSLTGYLELAAMRNGDESVKKFIEKAKQASVAIQKQMELTRTYQDVGTKDAEWIEVRTATENELAGMDLGKVKALVDLPEVEVLGDPLFMSCIHNIVHNSIKHGGKVQQVKISGYEDPTGFIIAIDDDGKGISSTQKQAIFDWNYNGRSGHGLNFVREVLNSTGMRVRETGTEGRGARFEIMVPHRYYRLKR